MKGPRKDIAVTQDQSKPERAGIAREPRRTPIPLAERRRFLDKAIKQDDTAPVIKDWASI